MVTLFVGGKPVGTLADAEKLLPELAARNEVAELRNEAGRVLGTLSPEPLCPWEPALTSEEVARRVSRPGKPLSEVLKRLGVE